MHLARHGAETRRGRQLSPIGAPVSGYEVQQGGRAGRCAALGAVIDRSAVRHVNGLIEDAAAKGAHILAGGQSDTVLMPATVVDGITSAMRLYRNESFGPVVGIIRARDEADAIRIANDTEYGLSAAVFTRDIARGLRIARQIRSGMCHINGATVHDEPQMPLEGWARPATAASAVRQVSASSPSRAGSRSRPRPASFRSDIVPAARTRWRFHPRHVVSGNGSTIARQSMDTNKLSTPLRLRTRGESDRAAMVRKETVANTIVTGAVAVLVTWLIFRNRELVPIFEAPPRGAFGIVPGTFNFTLLVTLILTLVVRVRVRKGRIGRGEVSRLAWFTHLMPRNVLMRAVFMACVMSLVFLPLTYGSIWLAVKGGLVPPAWSMMGMELLFGAHFMLLSVVVTSLVVAGALRD